MQLFYLMYRQIVLKGVEARVQAYLMTFDYCATCKMSKVHFASYQPKRDESMYTRIHAHIQNSTMYRQWKHIYTNTSIMYI